MRNSPLPLTSNVIAIALNIVLTLVFADIWIIAFINGRSEAVPIGLITAAFADYSLVHAFVTIRRRRRQDKGQRL